MADHRIRRPVRRWWAALTVACAALLAVGTATAVGEDDGDPVAVALAEKNGSGISGTATYGSVVAAEASGMNPDRRYVSFVYGAGSSASGNNPCIITGSSLAGPVLTVGEWDVDADGDGTLRAKAPLPADEAGTMSIREDTTVTGTVTGPLPVNRLVACGAAGERRDTPLGRVQDQLPPVKVPSP